MEDPITALALKPCPMCADPEPTIVGHPDAPKGKVFIGCETCGTRGMACEKREHAAKFWNRRTFYTSSPGELTHDDIDMAIGAIVTAGPTGPQALVTCARIAGRALKIIHTLAGAHTANLVADHLVKNCKEGTFH